MTMLALLYLFDFFRLDTAKKINLDNDRKFLYNKIRSGIQKYCYDLYFCRMRPKSVYIKQMIFVRGHDYVQCACS